MGTYWKEFLKNYGMDIQGMELIMILELFWYYCNMNYGEPNYFDEKLFKFKNKKKYKTVKGPDNDKTST